SFAKPGMGGFWAHDALYSRMLVTSDRRPTQFAVLKHELAHDLSDRLVPEQPPWLSEGLACYLETLRRDGDRFVLGEPEEARLGALQRHPMREWEPILRSGTGYVAERRRGWAFESA